MANIAYPGRTLTYTYNAAQQLTQVTDNAGNRVTYGYDPKGNRTGAFTYDPDGTLVRSMETAYDPRNHVQQLNQGGSVTQQVVDALGNLTRSTDPNQVASGSGIGTTHTYDALSRLIQTLDNLNGNTSYGYNPHDRLTQVTAPNGAMTQYVYDDLGNLLQEISPDRGTTTYGYDAAGNVTSQTDARGITVNYAYDALNRLTRIDYPADTDTLYTYDAGDNCTAGVGRLCQVVDGSGTTQYGYDAFGNVTVQVKTEIGQTYTTRYGYDLSNRVTSITYPDNRVASYSRDNVGRIAAVTATVNGVSTPIATGRTYRADGLLLTQTYGNGLNEARTYDTQGRLTYQSLGTADTRVYAYDANGNLTQQQALAEVGSYGYDALDRLIAESVNGLPYSAGYDANGNRLSAGAPGISASLDYGPNTNRLTQVTVNGVPYTVDLDAVGQVTNLSAPQGNAGLTYDGAGRLSGITYQDTPLARYAYDHRNLRTRKTTAVGTIVYHYDVGGRLLLETTDQGLPLKAYVWAEDQPLAQLDITPAGEVVRYLHPDHQGTPRLATDAQRRVVWSWDGEAFGSTLPNEDAERDGERTIINLRYAGQYYDSETGLHYGGARYWDPKTGRAISADPMSVAEHVSRWQANLGLPNRPPLEINPYVYTANNPLRWIDLGGFESDSPNAGNADFPDPSVPEPGLESPCIECIIVPAARAGKIAKTCIDIAKKDIVQKACKNAALAAALGATICADKPPGQFPRDRQRVEDVRKATEQTLRKNTGSVRDK